MLYYNKSKIEKSKNRKIKNQINKSCEKVFKDIAHI